MKILLKSTDKRIRYWRSMLSDWPQRVQIECILNNAINAQQSYRIGHPGNLVLLDSYGLDESTLRRELHNNRDSYLVVVDHESKWASYLIREWENFRVRDYVSQNLSENCLSEILSRCCSYQVRQIINKTEQIFLTIWNKGEKLFVNTKDIFLLEGCGAYTRIYAQGQEFVVSKTLKSLMETLPDCFIRTHRSFAIHLEYINSMRGDYVVLNNGQSVRASKQGKKNLFTRLDSLKYAIAQ